jgi:hypothetical protein
MVEGTGGRRADSETVSITAKRVTHELYLPPRVDVQTVRQCQSRQSASLMSYTYHRGKTCRQ